MMEVSAEADRGLVILLPKVSVTVPVPSLGMLQLGMLPLQLPLSKLILMFGEELLSRTLLPLIADSSTKLDEPGFAAGLFREGEK